MSDSDVAGEPKDINDGIADGEKYRDIGRAENYFRDKLGIDRTAYIILGGVYGHIEHSHDGDIEQDAEEYIANEYRKAERRVDKEFDNLSRTDIYDDSFIQEQIANYVEERIMGKTDSPFESLQWKINGGLQHIVTTQSDPVTDSQNAIDNPIVTDGGVDMEEKQNKDEEKSDHDEYNTYYQFIDQGLKISANKKNDALFQRVLQKIPGSRGHRYEDSFNDLLRESIMEKRNTIAARAANEVDKKMSDSKNLSQTEKIKVAVQGGLVTEAVKVSFRQLHKRSGEFMNEVLGNFDTETIMNIFQEIGNFLCENMDLIMSSLPF